MGEADKSVMLAMQGIEKSFAGNKVVKGVDFNCLAGEIHGLVGENGAGKSTLMKILAGVHPPDAGSITLEGERVSFSGYDKAREAGVCVVYQELSLLPGLSVAENIFMGRWRRGKSRLVAWRSIRERSRQALAMVGLENLDVTRLVGTLPMATRQLIEVAKALLDEPRIVVFDEPTTTLTEEEAQRLFALMRELKKQGKGIIFISHRLREILENCDRITVMKDGEKVLTDAAGAFDENKLIFHMIGRDLSDIYPPKLQGPSGPEIFSYSGTLDDGRTVEFSVHEGEVLGIGGLAGQGQVPVLESVFGLGGVDNVVVQIGDRKHAIKSPSDAMRSGIALIPEDRNGQAAFPILPIAENIASASLDRHSRFGVLNLLKEAREVREIADRLKVRMTSLSQEVMYLSGGNIQKTVFARWLLASHRVMVLLSPTSGIDVGTKQQIYSLIRELADGGVAVIVMTGDMMELIGLCDRVLVMYDSAVNGELTGPDITEENIMKASVAKAGERSAS